jgi:hypothetical protein
MKPENSIHCLDLDRFDEAGMRNRDRMQDTFERFLPKLQKTLQLRDGQGAGTGCSPWLGRTHAPASENLVRSRESPGH